MEAFHQIQYMSLVRSFFLRQREIKIFAGPAHQEISSDVSTVGPRSSRNKSAKLVSKVLFNSCV